MPQVIAKEIVINKQTNDILDTHFGGQVSLLKVTKITKLFDEGLITVAFKIF